ncbi:MAG: signal peptidase I [Patescibacteria group bacterium]
MKIFREFKFSKRKNLAPWQSAMVDFISDVVVIFVLVLVIIKPLFFAPFRVQQQSMTPNVLDGEFIIVWKTPYILGAEYSRGDIVVFRPPSSENYLIKRVVGLPGETLRIFDGFVWVEDSEGEFEKLNESFLSAANYGNTCLASSFCSDEEKARAVDFKIPNGEYFVMGDNRLASRDSRSCFEMNCEVADSAHFLSQKAIEGRAVLTFARLWEEGGQKHFSLTNTRILHNPNTTKLTQAD